MSKWFGKIGYADLVETSPGVWVEEIVTRDYYGDLTRISRRLQSDDQLNDEITISNELSIIVDPYANDHFHSMRYAECHGTKWKVSSVEVKYPRLIISLGGVFNGN